MSDLEIMRILDSGVSHSGFSGEKLTITGETADCCYVILEGQVEVRVRVQGSPKSVAVLEPGQMIGEIALFQPQARRMADTYVRQRALLVKLEYASLRNLAYEEPLLFDRLRQNLQGLAAGRVKSLREPAPVLEPEAPEPPAEPEAPSIPAPAMLAPVQIRMALSRCAIFQGMDDETLGSLMEIGEPIRLAAKDYLIRYGELADCLYVVALGRLSVLARVGKVVGPVAELGPGQCVGEFPLAFKQKRRMCSVATVTTSTLIRIRYDAIEKWAGRHLDAYRRLRENITALAEQRSES